MDHAEALELIELAAVEPDGLERLMAGDTPESAAVAGHLAGCPDCVAELARIRRSSVLVREVIAQQPDPALRARTLAFVREVGRDRSPGAAGPESVPAPEPAPAPAGAPEPVAIAGAATQSRLPTWAALGGIAAALVLAVGLGFVAGQANSPDTAGREIAVLQGTTEAMRRLGTQPDARRVELVATTAGTGSAGTLLFSPSSGELVMVTSGLARPGPGQEYGCWIEANGQRRRIGTMDPGGDLESWAGPVDGLADLPPDAVFGVSLVATGGAGAGEPMLTGGL